LDILEDDLESCERGSDDQRSGKGRKYTARLAQAVKFTDGIKAVQSLGYQDKMQFTNGKVKGSYYNLFLNVILQIKQSEVLNIANAEILHII